MKGLICGIVLFIFIIGMVIGVFVDNIFSDTTKEDGDITDDWP